MEPTMKPPKMSKRSDADMFRSQLTNIINMRHELVLLADKIGWGFFDQRFSALYAEAGRPGVSTRLMVGLHLLKHMYDLSDEAVCAQWVCNPYFQYFCGETYFQHELPIDRSSMTRWRTRIGADELTALVQESLNVAHRTEALRPQDLEQITVDTTVQPKAVAFPTDAKLMIKARENLVALAKEWGVALRQPFSRVGKIALIKQGRYAHAKQHNRARRELRRIKVYLGRVIRDIRRKIAGNEALIDVFRRPLWLAERVATQSRRDPYPKVYSLHAPEVECIGKGKARQPYEFGCKVTVATTNARSPGGQFVVHIDALHGNPYDGHTLKAAVETAQEWTGVTVKRVFVDKGYQGHGMDRFMVWKSGNKAPTETIRRSLRRRAAVEPVIGHMKSDGRLDRNYLKGKDGDRINAVLCGAGHNLRLVLAWLRILWPLFRDLICQAIAAQCRLQVAA
jgi:IS5 family transposase